VDDIVAAAVDVTAASLASVQPAIYQLTLKLAALEAAVKALGAVQT
jgi:hypothetical protein